MKAWDKDFLEQGRYKSSPGRGVWTWGDGISFHTLGVKFILGQEMLDPFQRHAGLQEGVCQPRKPCLFYPPPLPLTLAWPSTSGAWTGPLKAQTLGALL